MARTEEALQDALQAKVPLNCFKLTVCHVRQAGLLMEPNAT